MSRSEYMHQHYLVYKERGHPIRHKCVDCGRPAEHWTFNNIGDRNNVMDYDPRCPSCHIKFDYTDARRSKISGTNHWRSRLKDEQVLEIRQLYATGSWTYQELAKKYGVSYTCVRYIVVRKTWQHI